MSKLLKIGEASQTLGVNPQTLYFYERIGLIPPLRRTTAGYRLFSEQDIARLRFITRVKALGLSLDGIKEILVLQDGQTLTCEAMHCRLTAKVRQLEDQIQKLQVLRDELLPLIDQCQSNLSQAAPNNECVVVKEISDGA
ncbi:MAG: heavy metal-responsive transcriptional regulator [Elainellaceae cyanobacterium]